MKIKFKKLHPNAVIPKYQKDGDAGLDLTSVKRRFDKDKRRWEYSLGLAVEIPEGHVGLIFPRSSICKYDLALTNAVGVVDENFRGEIKAYFSDVSGKNRIYEVGERICQLIVMPYPKIEPEEVTQLSETERGVRGWGSSGV